MSSVYFFLVAEASAISSAPNTMSRGTFFSRARTSTSITNSRLPATTGLLAATFDPSQLRHQPRPLDVVERQAHRRLPFQFHRHAPVLGPAQRAHEPAAAGRVGRAHPHVSLLPRKASEIRLLAKRPVQSGGRNLEALVIHALDLEHPRELAAYRRAILDIDPARLVDEEAQVPPPVRRLQVDEFVPHAGHDRLYQCFQCRHKRFRAPQTKNGPKAHLFLHPSKLLKFNRICNLAPPSRCEIARQLDRSVADANQAAHARADGFEHPPHLAVATLLQRHAI